MAEARAVATISVWASAGRQLWLQQQCSEISSGSSSRGGSSRGIHGGIFVAVVTVQQGSSLGLRVRDKENLCRLQGVNSLSLVLWNVQ